MQLRNKLDEILKEYIRLFEEKHEVLFDYAVGDDLTGLLCFGDYLIHNERCNIRYRQRFTQKPHLPMAG